MTQAADTVIETSTQPKELRVKSFKLKLGGLFQLPGSRDEYPGYDVRQKHFQAYTVDYIEGQGVWLYDTTGQTEELTLIPLDHIACIVFEPMPLAAGQGN